MKEFQGIYLPDHEEHFPEWMAAHGEIVNGRGTYQMEKLRLAMRYVRDFRVAIDVGAHVGLWAMHLAPRFQLLHCIEPIADHRECFVANMRGVTNVMLHPVALGAQRGEVTLVIPHASSGGTHVVEGTKSSDYLDCYETNVPLLLLDELDIRDVDFIKIDCEGYEEHVIRGGEQTICRDKPCVVVEQKARTLRDYYGIKEGQPAVDLLRSWGYVVQAVKAGDYVLTCAN